MLFNLFKKKKNRPPVYTPVPEEYARLEIPAELRVLYRHIKIVFFLLFPIGIAIYFTPFAVFVIAAFLSLFISIHFFENFQELLNTRLKFTAFIAAPPVCLSTGYLFSLAFFPQIAAIYQGITL